MSLVKARDKRYALDVQEAGGKVTKAGEKATKKK